MSSCTDPWHPCLGWYPQPEMSFSGWLEMEKMFVHNEGAEANLRGPPCKTFLLFLVFFFKFLSLESCSFWETGPSWINSWEYTISSHLEKKFLSGMSCEVRWENTECNLTPVLALKVVRSEAFLITLHISVIVLGAVKEALDYRDFAEDLELAHSLGEVFVTLLIVLIRSVSQERMSTNQVFCAAVFF